MSNSSNQRVALLLEYNGHAYHGSQSQPALDTIQDTVQTALAKLRIPFEGVAMSGRTDAGVHARGQVLHFDCPADSLDNIPDLNKSVNAILPETIRVKDAKTNVDGTFHSRRESTHKWYRYKIFNHPTESVWRPVDATWVRAPLDVDLMNQAADLLQGKHNFKSFKSANTPVIDDVCTILYTDVYKMPQMDGDCIIFDIVSDRFLYKMVRNLAGQLIEMGSNSQNTSPSAMSTVLHRQDRNQAAPTADPNGLCQMAVQYPPKYNFFPQDPYVMMLNQLIAQQQPQSTEHTNHYEHNKNLFRKAS